MPRITDPYKAFMRRATWMAEDLAAAVDVPPIARVYEGDARDARCWDAALAGRRAGAVITSPPYLNNFDYADATRLELYFWKVVGSWKQMTMHVRSGMIVATTQQSRRQLAAEASEMLAQLCPATHKFVQGLIASLQRERASRARGKEYDQLLPSYFVDLALVMIRIRQGTVPGAPVALVLGDSAPYGVYVDTPALIVSAAQELGFSHETTQTLRRRGLRWHTNGRRHSVGLSEKLVLLRLPDAQ
jgi:hypothetical protein